MKLFLRFFDVTDFLNQELRHTCLIHLLTDWVFVMASKLARCRPHFELDFALLAYLSSRPFPLT
jgi:hypothetical protein